MEIENDRKQPNKGGKVDQIYRGGGMLKGEEKPKGVGGGGVKKAEGTMAHSNQEPTCLKE